MERNGKGLLYKTSGSTVGGRGVFFFFFFFWIKKKKKKKKKPGLFLFYFLGYHTINHSLTTRDDLYYIIHKICTVTSTGTRVQYSTILYTTITVQSGMERGIVEWSEMEAGGKGGKERKKGRKRGRKKNKLHPGNN